MKKVTHIVALLLLLSLPSALLRGQQAKHIVLITVDGLRPECYLDSSWGMVNLRHLMANGAAAKGVNPVYPSVTDPDHITMITGVTPAKHGIYFNTPFRPNVEGGMGYTYYDSIKTETLFDAFRKSGGITAAISWPVSAHGPIDFNVPLIAVPGSRDMREATAANIYPPDLWKVLQDSATGHVALEDWTIINDEIVMDENVARMGAYLIRTRKPAFTAIHFGASDHYQHEYGRDGYVVRAAVAGIDRGIKSIMEAINRAGIQDSTTIIVMGDHGFEDFDRSFHPNVLLKQNGLLNDVKKGDWKARFYSMGSTFLFLKDPKDVKTLATVQSLLKALPDSVKQYFKLIDKKQLDSIGAVPGAAFAFTPLKGASFDNRQDGDLISVLDRVKGTHGLYPDHKEIQTGFIASGAGIRKGVVVQEMSMLDVCPLIIHLTGLPFHEMQGKCYPELLTRQP